MFFLLTNFKSKSSLYFQQLNLYNPVFRFHFAKFVEGLSAKNCEKAQLGLGHSYSRCKVKFNVHRVDNMIIQSIALLDQIDKDINTFSMRLRLVSSHNVIYNTRAYP